jgi:hypothetical protein
MKDNRSCKGPECKTGTKDPTTINIQGWG